MTITDARRGFTLVELIIVVAIVGVLAAIAIPSILNSRKAGNESSAINYMRSWVTAQQLYKKKFGHYADADEQLIAAKLITATKGDGEGYKFALDNPPNSHWEWWGRGWPALPGTSGDRYFYIDTTGRVRVESSGHANKNSPLIGK